MKPALVLGLAIAANAMVADQGDNELIVAPHRKYEHDIAQRFPSKIMYDELADDELAVRQKVIHGFPESFAAADDELAYKLVINRPHLPVTEPAAFDDHEFARKTKEDRNRDKEVVTRLGYVNPATFFDEVADDELAVRQKVIHGFPESFAAADDELALKFVHRPVAPAPEFAAFDDHEFAKKSKEDRNRDKEVVTRLGYVNPATFFDEVADDELAMRPDTMRPAAVRPVTLPSGEKTWVAWDDDEFAVRQKVIHGFPESFAAADDELALKIVPRPHLPVTEPIAFDDHEFAKKSKEDRNRDKEVVTRLGYVNPATFFDEVADDELAYKLVINRPNIPTTEPVAFDDHEFAKKSKEDRNRDKEVVTRLGYVNPATFFDDVADDELLVSPPRDMTRYGFDASGRVLRDNIGRPVKPVLHRFDEVADDELAYKLVINRPHLPVTEPIAFDDHEFARKPKGDSNRDKEVVTRLGYVNPATFFDEADDELAYLGKLIGDGGYIHRYYDDDELRVEKPSHVKAEERAQFKSELPKKQRKFRPHPDVIPMTEN